VKEIPLVSGRYHEPSGLVTLVDDEDYEGLQGRYWRVFIGNNGKLYAAGGDNDLLHRVILNAPKDLQVDHLNGDGLDNVRSNLRLATRSQNLANQASRIYWSRRRTTSNYKGVSLLEGRSRPWRATISVDRKQHFLGYYAEEDAAARAYDDAARRFFGEFARTNFVVGDA
jgi:hypothetical protein